MREKLLADSCLSSVWRQRALAIALLALACNRETSPVPPPSIPPSGRLRTTLPRLTGFEAWRACKSHDGGSIAKSDCGPVTIPPRLVSLRVGECDREMNTQANAVEVLAYVPDCTDAAVARLARYAASRKDPVTSSDLAAAYYLRAQRNDRPSDLVRALDAAEAAVALAPASIAARFNRALALETLGFVDDAMEAWDSLQREAEAGWATEAHDHWRELTRARTLSAANQWPQNLERLPLAARAQDRKAVAALVTPYPAAAQIHVEQEILPQWAKAAREGHSKEAEERLALAEMIASALSAKDRYLLDIVERIRTSPRSRVLHDGLFVFSKARHEEVLQRELAAADYAIAEQAFVATGNPLRLGAMLGRVPALTLARRRNEALQLLTSIERLGRRYPHILARVHAARGFLHLVEGHHLDAIHEYGHAESIYASLGDSESLAHVHLRRTGLFRTVGQEDLTWRELFQALRYASALSDAQGRHAFLGEAASAAAALGFPNVALRYQNQAVELLRRELSGNAPDSEVPRMRLNLGVALRARASIRAQSGDADGAGADLDEAVDLMGEEAAEGQGAIVSGLRARVAEVEAQTTKDRKMAIILMTEAVDYAETTHYHTLLASLLTRRADLYRDDGQRRAAVADLERAIAVLRKEEQAMLAGDIGAVKERVWSAYFSRYQEAFQQLIALLIEAKENAKAFEYSEKARAYEPLHRVLQRHDVPESFLRKIRGGEPLGIEEVKRALPEGTFLLQYAVLQKQTVVWLIWHKDVELLPALAVGNNEIEAWTAELQRLADTRAHLGWDRALHAPYEGLLAQPITRIAALHQGTELPKIVIVPDRAMHGLPFPALQDGKSQPLIRKHRVSVAPSATLYAYSLEQDRQLALQKPQSVLIVADPEFDRNLDVAAGLPSLTSARAEAEQIERIYKPVVNVPPPLMGKKATIPAFLSLAGGSTVIHISSHGVANPTVPSQSFLLLAPTESDTGVLDAERLITQLRLDRTRLVVLSACSTAGGTRVGPEGLAPLVRPLVAAGVTGIVGTLWQVPDSAATAELVVRFHQYYRDGKDADEALRLAQLSMFEDRDLGLRPPRIWAPFQMIGHASSPFARINKNRR